MDAHARALACGIKAFELGGALHIRVEAPHRIVLSRLDWHRLLDWVNAYEVDGEISDTRQPLEDLLPPEVPQVEVHIVPAFYAPPLIDLRLDRPRDYVPGAELHGFRRIFGHEPLAEAVYQIPAF